MEVFIPRPTAYIDQLWKTRTKHPEAEFTTQFQVMVRKFFGITAKDFHRNIQICSRLKSEHSSATGLNASLNETSILI